MKEFEIKNPVHKEALKKIKDYDFISLFLNNIDEEMVRVLSNFYENTYVYYDNITAKIDDNNKPLLSYMREYHGMTLYQIHRAYTFEVLIYDRYLNTWVKDIPSTTAWRKFMIERYPAYKPALMVHLENERKRKHKEVNKEIDAQLAEIDNLNANIN